MNENVEAKALLITVLNSAILALSLTVASTVLYDGDFNELDPNPLVFVIFINLKSEIFAEGQSFVVHSGLREAMVTKRNEVMVS